MNWDSGYRLDLENRKALKAACQSFSVVEEVCRDVELPEEIDPRPWHRIENQGAMGSCQGHALSSVMEYCFRIATGAIIQFSPLFAYYATQKIDGLQGRDQGSTISGGAECAQTYGCCPLEVMPYRLPYNWHLPEEAIEAAAPYKIRSKTWMRSYAQIKTFLGTGQGGVELGIAWSRYCEPQNGIIETYRPGGGGHAVAFLGYSRRKDGAGRNYLWMANSWRKTYGQDGYAEVAPKAVDQMFQHNYTVMVGLSDLSTPEPRIPNTNPW